VKPFDENLLRQLENLRLAVRKSVRGRKEGERSTSRRGGAAEFVSHRDYTPGDDLRAIDWPLYARLGELFVREFSREETPTLHLVIDSTPSMKIGDGSKRRLSLHLAAGLGAVAFAESARVFLGDRSHERLGTLLPSLELTEGAPETALRALGGARESGMVVLLSDLWEETLRQPLLRASAAGDVVLLHILSPEELSPSFEGRHRLLDAESGEAIDRHVGPAELESYRGLLEAHCESWKNWAREHGMSYVLCPSDADWMGILTRTLREAGLYR
jgi:uncharacterized protein (DUF58 family)